MATQDVTFSSDNIHLHGVLSTPTTTKSEIGILFLHGGGHSSAERYRDVQDFFSNHGVASLAISFRGCGKSAGDFSKSTLSDRLLDADSALQEFKLATGLSDQQIYLWGSSMGGHVAARLISRHLQLKGLILQSAAAYGQNAESAPFGSKFSDSIDEENNWINSHAFTDLSTYQNQTLIIYGKDDEVIPNQVKQLYLSSAKHPQYHIISGYGHPMLRPATDIEKEAWDSMVNLVLNFISGN
jgi:hypothetical protein